MGDPGSPRVQLIDAVERFACHDDWEVEVDESGTTAVLSPEGFGRHKWFIHRKCSIDAGDANTGKPPRDSHASVTRAPCASASAS